MGEKTDTEAQRLVRRLTRGDVRLWLLAIGIVFTFFVIVHREPPSDVPLPPITKPSEYRVLVKGTKPVALVTTVALRRGELEYGELKAAYVYAVSMANKARYCLNHGWSLILGGEVPETRGRSARWNKVAWLRRLASSYEWLLWMDLDTLFVRFDVDLITMIAKDKDAYFTLDQATPYETETKVNTGSFLLRGQRAWTATFLWKVWQHNDAGLGVSDQRSINAILKDEQSHVSLVPKTLVNAFPDVSFVPTESYEKAPRGDETSETLVVHFAGQFAGARASDGQTPPTMLVQFLDVLLDRHERALSGKRKNNQTVVVQGARDALAECLARIRNLYTERVIDAGAGVEFFAPARDDDKCDARTALRNAKEYLGALLPPKAPQLLCSRPSSYASVAVDPDSLIRDLIVETPRHKVEPFPTSGPRLEGVVASPVEWKSISKTWTAKFLIVTVLHECAAVLRSSTGLAIASATHRLDLDGAPSDDDDGIAPRSPRRPNPPGRTRRRQLEATTNHAAASSSESSSSSESTVKVLGSAVVLGPVPSRRQLFPTEFAATRGDEVVAASYFWRFLAPLALACLDSVPQGTRLVVLASTDDEYAPFVASDDDWRAIDVMEKPLFLLSSPMGPKRSQKEAPAVYAEAMYSCHIVEEKHDGTYPAVARRDLLKVAAANLNRVQRILRDDPNVAPKVGIVVVCGAPGGFRDCGAVVDAARKVAGPSVDVRSSIDVSHRDEAAWHGLSRRRFLPAAATDVLIFPRVAERFDVAPLLCLPCRPGTALLQLSRSSGSLQPYGYSFTKLAADTLGFTLVTASGDPSDASALATPLPRLIAAATDFRSLAAPGVHDGGLEAADGDLLEIHSISSRRRRSLRFPN